MLTAGVARVPTPANEHHRLDRHQTRIPRGAGCSADILMLMGSREGSKVLYRNIVSEVFDCHRPFAIVAGINAEKIAALYGTLIHLLLSKWRVGHQFPGCSKPLDGVDAPASFFRLLRD